MKKGNTIKIIIAGVIMIIMAIYLFLENIYFITFYGFILIVYVLTWIGEDLEDLKQVLKRIK